MSNKQDFATPFGDARPAATSNIGMPWFRSPFDTQRVVGPNGIVSLHGNIDTSIGSATSSDVGGTPLFYREPLFGLPGAGSSAPLAPRSAVADEAAIKCNDECQKAGCATGTSTRFAGSDLCVCSGCPLRVTDGDNKQNE